MKKDNKIYIQPEKIKKFLTNKNNIIIIVLSLMLIIITTVIIIKINNIKPVYKNIEQSNIEEKQKEINELIIDNKRLNQDIENLKQEKKTLEEENNKIKEEKSNLEKQVELLKEETNNKTSSINSSTGTTTATLKTSKSSSVQNTDSQIVYITNTGKKYHKSGCSYLSKSKKSISLSEAKSLGYTACSRCY